MEWQWAFLLILGSLLILFFSGLPVAFCFIFVNLIGIFVWWGGIGATERVIMGIWEGLKMFSLLPVLFFAIMGEVLLHSGIAPDMMDVVDKWLGRLPGRLALVSVGSGVVLSFLTSNSMASVAMLGTVLVPEMEKRGYKKPMSIGPILGSGGLAMMIPPSGLAVLLGALGAISIGRILIGGIMPGIMLAVLYSLYIIIRCWLQPSIAPSYVKAVPPLSERLMAIVRHILPVAIVIFMVIGVVILGVATPTEAAATGTIGSFLVAALHRRLNWKVVKKTITGTLQVATMIFMIVAGAAVFGNNLAYTGATRGLVALLADLPVAPMVIMILMQVILLMLGMFMEVIAMMMITIPLFMPIVHAVGFNDVWFAILYLLNIEVALISPPFGMSLFVMKGVAPPDTTMVDIWKAALPFIVLDIVALVSVMVFPQIGLWLPGFMP